MVCYSHGGHIPLDPNCSICKSNNLENSGTTLAMNENSKKLDRLTIAVWCFIFLQIALIVGIYWFFDHFNIVDYVAFKMNGGD